MYSMQWQLWIVVQFFHYCLSMECYWVYRCILLKMYVKKSQIFFFSISRFRFTLFFVVGLLSNCFRIWYAVRCVRSNVVFTVLLFCKHCKRSTLIDWLFSIQRKLVWLSGGMAKVHRFDDFTIPKTCSF